MTGYPGGQPVSGCRNRRSEHPLHKNLHSNPDQNHAAQYGGFIGKLRPEFLTDDQPDHANDEGDRRDDQRTYERREEAVIRDRESDGQRVDGGCHALYEKGGNADLGRLHFFVFAVNSFEQHLAADHKKQDQRDPRHQLLERFKVLRYGMHADPADHRHNRLKYCEHACDTAHLILLHSRLVKPIREGYREGVHRQSDTK